MVDMEQMIEILSQYTELSKDKIQPESRIIEDLGLTSLDVMDLIGELEDQYGLEISDEDIRAISTVQDIADYIEKNAA